MTSKKLLYAGGACIALALFYRFYGRYKVQETELFSSDSNLWQCYGVKSTKEILRIIDNVADNFSYGANKTNLKRFLFEIIATESDFGNAKDTTLSSGEGLTQFDKITFNELHTELKNKGTKFGDCQNVLYETLRKNPAYSVLLCRYFLYRRIPSAIPSDMMQRARQWKVYYNTRFGKGTESHYINMANKWYAKLNPSYRA